MTEIYRSAFSNEISAHMAVRHEELTDDSFRHYNHVVFSFDDYLSRLNICTKTIDEEIVDGWIKSISSGISPNTVGHYIHHIRQLLLYLRTCGYQCYIPENRKVRDMYVPYIYTEDEIARILKAADNLKAPKALKNIWIEHEFPMFLRVLFCCGLRTGETLSIKREDIDFERSLVILKVTKKYKQRLVPFGQELSSMLYRYCMAMKIMHRPEAYIFPGVNENSPLSQDNARNYFKIVLKSAGIDRTGYKAGERGPCLHCFRHTFAVRSFHQTESIGMKATDAVPFLSTYLGHDSLYETEKYLKYSGDYFDETLKRFEAYTYDVFPEVGFND